MTHNLTKYFLLSACLLIIFFISCNEDATQPVTENIIFEKQGLLDSAVVTQCVSDTRRYFTDTLDLSNVSQVNIEFDGNTNSDGSFIKVFWNDETSNNNLVYSAVDLAGVPGHHMHILPRPSNKIWFEIRIYINPPVCGTGDFKFTSARNLKINAVN